MVGEAECDAFKWLNYRRPEKAYVFFWIGENSFVSSGIPLTLPLVLRNKYYICGMNINKLGKENRSYRNEIVILIPWFGDKRYALPT